MSASKHNQAKNKFILSNPKISYSQNNTIIIFDNSQDYLSKPQVFETQQKINIYPLRIKNYITKFKSQSNFSDCKFNCPKKKLAAQIYKRKQLTQKQKLHNQFLYQKSFNLIKENLLKMDKKFSNRIPKLLRNSQRKRFSFCNISKNIKNINKQCKKQIQIKQLINQKNNNVFLFQYLQNQRKQLISKKKSSIHFDRLKYFKKQNPEFLDKSIRNKQKVKTKNIRKQTQNQNRSASQNHQKRLFFQQSIPKQRVKTPKPTTAGGWLKKYKKDQYFFRQDAKINFDDFSFG